MVALAPFVDRRLRNRLAVVASARADDRLDRLLRPLCDALYAVEGEERPKIETAFLLLRECAHLGRPYWAWDRDAWLDIFCPSQGTFLARHKPGNQTYLRQYAIAVAYLLDLFRDVHALGGIEMARFARKVFGSRRFADLLAPVVAVNSQWGYRCGKDAEFVSVAAEMLLRNRDPDPRHLTRPFLERVHAELVAIPRRRAMVYRLSRILVHCGWLEEALPLLGGVPDALYKAERERGIAAEWVAWVERWHATSVRSLKTRHNIRGDLLRVGRWLAAHRPDITAPDQWTRELAAEFVAAVDRMHGGDFTVAPYVPVETQGQPFSPRRKHSLLSALRCSFGDAQEWGWIARRFDPMRAFATPRSVRLLFGTAPRVIEDDIWAKLLWAGLNLSAADCPLLGHPHPPAPAAPGPDRPAPEVLTFYPPEMIRAVAILWLFAGPRSDELARLRVGCVRTQAVVAGTAAGETAPTPVCLLDVPVNKTGGTFTKPVDPLVGEAIAAWEAARPTQPDLPDPKTGERVPFLFCYRAKRLSKVYLNHSLIPALCAKAGVPRADARGRISSHRARSTIASQLFNAREPMSLFELQAWLGHRSPASTQSYVAITPTKLAKAYGDAGYFARNMRTIEVLIDRDAVQNGTATGGTPWQYFDLGHGYCSYSFFDQCPHRMACARCDFYLPKGSTKAQLLEAKDNLQRMLASIPLTDDERAAVEDGAEALDRLLERLADVPTPGGATPRQLSGKPLPVIPSAPRGSGGD